MELFAEIDWQTMLLPQTPLLEIFVRGTVLYLFIFALIRFLLRRTAGTIDIPDLLLVVLIADAAQNGMANDYRSISEGILLVGVIAFWSAALDWLSFKYCFAQRLIRPAPSRLVRDGEVLWPTMRRHLISRAELMTQLREQGIEDVKQVKAAYLEADGRISIIAREGSQGTGGSDGNAAI